MKDPESHLATLALRFRSPVNPRLEFQPDSARRVWIGQDLFYFASEAERSRFVADPLRWCRALTDPVTQRRFHPTSRSPRLSYAGRPYWFASDSTRGVFVAKPDSFAVRGPLDEGRPMKTMPVRMR